VILHLNKNEVGLTFDQSLKPWVSVYLNNQMFFDLNCT
jgi:hypothetical protein